ncbi:MAG: hypothetical protein ACLR06_08765 [Christensenellaceae bacterium]
MHLYCGVNRLSGIPMLLRISARSAVSSDCFSLSLGSFSGSKTSALASAISIRESSVEISLKRELELAFATYLSATDCARSRSSA